MVAVTPNFDSEPLYKEQFATFLFQGFTPFVAAYKIWPQDAGFALKISEQWRDDAYVQQCVATLKDIADAANKPPEKEALIKDIHSSIPRMRDEDKLKAYRLIAEMSGFIEKAAPPQVNIDQRTQVNRVMIMPDHGTDEEWEAKLAEQQDKLMHHARTNH